MTRPLDTIFTNATPIAERQVRLARQQQARFVRDWVVVSCKAILRCIRKDRRQEKATRLAGW